MKSYIRLPGPKVTLQKLAKTRFMGMKNEEQLWVEALCITSSSADLLQVWGILPGMVRVVCHFQSLAHGSRIDLGSEVLGAAKVGRDQLTPEPAEHVAEHEALMSSCH